MKTSEGSFTSRDGLTLFERAWLPDGEAKAVVVDRPVEGGVQHHAPDVQVEVVLEGHADAPVHLHALVDDFGAVVADVGLRRAHDLLCVPGVVLDGGGGAVGEGEAGLQPGLQSAKRCLSAWYEARGRPNE